MGYFKAWRGGTPSILIITTETQPVSYVVEAPGIKFYRNGTIIAGNDANIYLPNGLYISIEASIANSIDTGIIVKTSSDRVSVFGQTYNRQNTFNSSGTYLALPIVSSCIEEYVYYRMSVAGNNLDSILLIVATDNDTSVDLFITNEVYFATYNSDGYLFSWVSNHYHSTMHRFQTAYIAYQSDSDYGNSVIKVVTNKPMSVFSGHQCAAINHTGGCDYLIEQIPPTHSWGTVHHVAPFVTKKFYTIKILAAQNYTNLTLYCNNTMESHIINESIYFEKVLDSQQYCSIHSDKRVLVAQLGHGQIAENSIGDPLMIVLPAVRHYTNEFLFSTFRQPNYIHYINVVVMAPFYQPDMIYLVSGGVNRSLDTQEWVPVYVNNVIEAYVTRVNISEGVAQVIHINATALLTVTVYGFSYFKGYGHSAGFKFPITSNGMKNFVYLYYVLL